VCRRPSGVPAWHCARAAPAGQGTGRTGRPYWLTVADGPPVRRQNPGQPRRCPRFAGRRPQPPRDPTPARHDLPHGQTPRRRHYPGGPLSRPVARPPLRPRRVQALPGRPLEPGLRQRLEGMGGDRATRLHRQLPASSRLLPHQAPLGRPGHRTPGPHPARSPAGSSGTPSPSPRANSSG
jgi:hypothetical protein